MIESFSGAGASHSHATPFRYDADHPAVLVGNGPGADAGRVPAARAGACLTAGIANVAAARGVTLTSVESTIEGDINLRGILGLSDQVRNGYERIRVNFTIEGDAPAEKLREDRRAVAHAVGRVRRLTNGVPVDDRGSTRSG